jgi:hypothetical protein
VLVEAVAGFLRVATAFARVQLWRRWRHTRRAAGGAPALAFTDTVQRSSSTGTPTSSWRSGPCYCTTLRRHVSTASIERRPSPHAVVVASRCAVGVQTTHRRQLSMHCATRRPSCAWLVAAPIFSCGTKPGMRVLICIPFGSPRIRPTSGADSTALILKRYRYRLYRQLSYGTALRDDSC